MKICIDAGRGGKDTGRKAGKILEKHITMGFAEILAEQLKKQKLQYALTRQRDENVSIDARVKIARSSGADVIITIHCNASRNTASSGVFVGRYLPDCQGLVDAVAAKLKCKSGFSDLEILRKVEIPAIVIRIGYISSPHDIKKILLDEEYLTGMAIMISEAVKDYGSK